VIAVMMMQAPLVEIVHVVAVRHHGVVSVIHAFWSMRVPCMHRAPMVRRTPVGILLADVDAVQLDGIAFLMLEAVVVQVVDVVSVPNGEVPASGSVVMCHGLTPSAWLGGCIMRSSMTAG